MFFRSAAPPRQTDKKMSTTTLNNHILTAVAAKIEQRRQRKCIDFQVALTGTIIVAGEARYCNLDNKQTIKQMCYRELREQREPQPQPCQHNQ